MIRNIVFTILLLPLFACGQELGVETFHLSAEQYNGIGLPANYVFSKPREVKVPRFLKLLAGRTSIDIVNLSFDSTVCEYYPIAQEHIFLFRHCINGGWPRYIDANDWVFATSISLSFPKIDSLINLKQAEATIYYR